MGAFSSTHSSQGGVGSPEDRLQQYAICRLEGLTHIEAEATMIAGEWYHQQVRWRGPSTELRDSTLVIMRNHLEFPYRFPPSPSDTESFDTPMTQTHPPTCSDVFDFTSEQRDEFSPLTPTYDRMHKVFIIDVPSPDDHEKMHNPCLDPDRPGYIRPCGYRLKLRPNITPKKGPHRIWPPMLCFEGQIYTHHGDGRPLNLIGGSGNVHDKLVQYRCYRRTGCCFRETVFRMAEIGRRVIVRKRPCDSPDSDTTPISDQEE